MTNRERLNRAIRDLERVASDEAVSPTPYEHLATAIARAREAALWVLDEQEAAQFEIEYATQMERDA